MSRPANNSDAVMRQTCTIANGASKSSKIDISSIGPRGLAVLLPCTSSSWTSADVTFEVSATGSDSDGDWFPVEDAAGNPIRITGIVTTPPRTGVTNLLYVAPAGAWAIGAYPWLRLVSIGTGTSQAAVNQGGDRTLQVVMLG